METTRQSKIGRLLQKELSGIFLAETRKMNGVMISVSAVRVSPDLGIAKVYLSIFSTGNPDDLLQNIRGNAKDIRHQLAQIVRFQLRKVPELQFYIDDSLDYIEKIDALLK